MYNSVLKIQQCIIDNLEEENKELQQKIDKAIEYNEHLIRDAKYHLNLGHLKKMKKILQGEDNENI